MRCPFCGAPQTGVRKTRSSGVVVWRQRNCEKCLKRFSTREIIAIPSGSDSQRIREPQAKVVHDRMRLAEEAKAIVALAIRNGPMKDLHAQIGQNEMKHIMKTAVDRVYSLLWFKEKNAIRYGHLLEAARPFVSASDEPELTVEF